MPNIVAKSLLNLRNHTTYYKRDIVLRYNYTVSGKNGP